MWMITALCFFLIGLLLVSFFKPYHHKEETPKKDVIVKCRMVVIDNRFYKRFLDCDVGNLVYDTSKKCFSGEIIIQRADFSKEHLTGLHYPQEYRDSCYFILEPEIDGYD